MSGVPGAGCMTHTQTHTQTHTYDRFPLFAVCNGGKGVEGGERRGRMRGIRGEGEGEREDAKTKGERPRPPPLYNLACGSAFLCTKVSR
jgi:hypothetical protein